MTRTQEGTVLMNLKLFGVGATAGGQAEGTADGTEGAETKNRPASGQQGTGEVLYGKPDGVPEPVKEDIGTPAAGEMGKDTNQADTLTPEQRKEQFGKFLKENKDLDEERMRGIFNRRFKDVQKMGNDLEAVKPVMALLEQLLGVPVTPETAAEIMLKDDNFMNMIADRVDKSPESIKSQFQVDKYKREAEAARTQVRVQQQSQLFEQEAKALQQVYPNFDLQELLADPVAYDLLSAPGSRLSMQNVYEALHIDDIRQSMGQAGAERGAQQAVARMQQGLTRPEEAGSSGTKSGVLHKFDVNAMTDAEILEAARQSERGRTVRF